jgi:hypothetical protein
MSFPKIENQITPFFFNTGRTHRLPWAGPLGSRWRGETKEKKHFADKGARLVRSNRSGTGDHLRPRYRELTGGGGWEQHGGGARRGRDRRRRRGAVWRRGFSSSTSSRWQLEGAAGTPGTAARPRAQCAPASSNGEANCWETMSRREREVVWIFSGKQGALS